MKLSSSFNKRHSACVCFVLPPTPSPSIYYLSCIPGGSVVKNPPVMQELLEMWIQSLDWKDPLEEGMATKSSILVWSVPWTDKPDRLQSIGLKRVEHE